MTPRTRFDQALSDFCARSIDRIATLTLTDASASALLAQVLPLLQRALTTLDPAVQSASNANADAYEASEERRAAEAGGEADFARLHNLLQARYFLTVATDPAAATTFQRRFERATAGNSPASFVPLGIERTQDILTSTLAFATDTLGADDAAVKAAQLGLARLSTARTAADREQGEAALTMVALETARDQARRLYVAARAVLDAALLIEGLPDSAARFMSPIASIYRPASAGGADGSIEEPVVGDGSGGPVGGEAGPTEA